MKKNKIGLFALALGSLGFITCCTNGETNGNSDSLQKNETFIVSLSGTSVTLGENGVKNAQNKFISELRNRIGYEFTVEKKLDAINVLTIKANRAYESIINSIPGVEDVAINQVYRFGDTFVESMRTQNELKEGYIPYTFSSVNEGETKEEDVNHNYSADSMNVPASKNGGSGSLIAILDTGYMLNHQAFADFTGEQKIKADARLNYEKLSGLKGLVATQAPNAKKGEEGSLYYNSKIPFYYDYGGSNLNAQNGYDVYSKTSEHGNHVASIAAANGTYQGIAPNAQLALMKVFYQSIPTDSTSAAGTYAQDQDIIEALNDCVVLGVDTLNMSLGTDLDDFSDKSASMAIIDKLTESGVNCNISAGNAGKDLFKSMNLYKNWSTDMVDTGILGSYANSNSANIIASSTNEKQFYEKAIQLNGEDGVAGPVIAYEDQVSSERSADIPEEDQKLLEDVSASEFILVENNKGETFGAAADYSEMIANAGGNSDLFRGKIAVVDRGTTSFIEKAKAAAQNKCAALVVINNDPTAYEFTFGMSWNDNGSTYKPEIPVVFVLYRDRQTILDHLKLDSSTHAKVGTGTTLKDKIAVNPNKNELSDFSSDGASFDLNIGPVITSPGSSIRGAILGKTNSQGMVEKEDSDPTAYGYLSGTSMAAPNFTGAVALMVGEQEFKTEDERKEYLRSIAQRTQSTAQIYTHEVTTYGKINEEIGKKTESNGETKDVTIYVPEEKDVKVENVPYSPRKQGAGVADVNKALTSAIYLEGLTPSQNGEYVKNEDGSYTSNGFGEVELKNNGLVKNGTVNLGLKIHNTEKISGITYKTELVLMTPQITTYHNHDNELANYVGDDALYEGAKMQGASSTILKTISLKDIVLDGNETQYVTDLKYTLSKDEKEWIDANFDNGTFLEGYLKLTPTGVDTATNTKTPALNVPFMGFYGDYGQADAVEPFNFEKETSYDRINGEKDSEGNTVGRLYGSDLVNYTATKGYGHLNADMSSTIAGVSFDEYDRNSYKASILVNSDNLTSITRSHPLTTKKEDNGEYTLYVGGLETDTLLINQFVYRSITSAKASIVDMRGKTILSKNITDIVDNNTSLFKSHVSGNYIGAGIIAHRAYCELPLYYPNGGKIADGNYKIKFKYTLSYGSVQEKVYNLVIDGSAPQLTDKSIVDINGKKYLRLKFNEVYIDKETKITVNGISNNAYILTKVSDGYVVDIPVSEPHDKYFVQLIDASYNFGIYVFNKDNIATGLMLSSKNLAIASNYTYKVESNVGTGNIDDTYEITVDRFVSGATSLGTYSAYLTYSHKINSTVRVYGIDEKGKEVRISDVELIGDKMIKITTSFTKFRIVDEGETTPNAGDPVAANISISKTKNGKVICDKTEGNVGDHAVIYAIPDVGYKVASVKVNGEEITSKDSNGNYIFVLEETNNIEVTFEKKVN